MSDLPGVMAPDGDPLWIPDHPDGSGWATVDWSSVLRGSRHHYRHAEGDEEARELRPGWYRVVTRANTPGLHAPHENSYYPRADQLADFLAEVILAGGAETLWHVEPVTEPPLEPLLGGQ